MTSTSGKTEYYIELQRLTDKVKDLKGQITNSEDDESIYYLRKAVDKYLEDMRLLIKENS